MDDERQIDYDVQRILESLARLSPVQTEFDAYQRACFPERRPEFFALELAGEAGEVANNEKKLWKGRDVEPSRLADEAADVFIALVNYANSRGINLAEAVAAKLRTIDAIRKDRAANGMEY